MKMNTTSIILLAAAAAGGYYFYTKQKSAKSAASKVSVEEDKGDEETEEQKPNSYGTSTGYGSQQTYSAAPTVVSTLTSKPKQKLTVLKKLRSGETKFTDLVSQYAKKVKAKRKKIVKRKVSGFDNCIGLF